jgi:hypothetical protein
MNLGLYQGAPAKKGITTVAMAASANPILADKAVRDPTLFCTGLKRQRFYMFTRSEPEYVLVHHLRWFFFFFRVSFETLTLPCWVIEIPVRNPGTEISSMSVRHGKSSRSPPPRQPPHRLVRPRSRPPLRSIRRWETCTYVSSRSRLPRRWKTSSGMRGVDTTMAYSSIA